MTTTLLDTAPAVSHRFATVTRGRGYHRVGGAVVAAGTQDGVQRRLMLGLERVAVATVTYRASQAEFEVSGGGGERVQAAVKAMATHAGLTGRAELSVRVPWPRDSGTDVTTAAVWATLNAFSEATDTPMTSQLRQAVVAAAGGTTPLASEEGFGVFDQSSGAIETLFDSAPRFGVLMWHRPGSTTHDLTAVGTLPTDDMPAGIPDAAAWLSELNGTPPTHLAQLLREAASADPAALGVVGGHDEDSSAAILVAPGADSFESARRLRLRVTSAAEGRLDHVPTFVISART